METITIPKILERLQRLPSDKLSVVYDFISYLADRQSDLRWVLEHAEGYQTMLASEDILRLDWDTPEEDEAWANL